VIYREFDDIVAKHKDKVVTVDSTSLVNLVSADDNLGFLFGVLYIDEGSAYEFSPRTKAECFFCIQGTGTVTEIVTGEVGDLHPGALFVIKSSSPYKIVADEEVVLVRIEDDE
jgi:L-ectoine synthase